jgi:hypothetical protein
MTVTDGDRYAIAMAKLSQARSAVYEATRIIEHLFESDGKCPVIEGLPRNSTGNNTDTCDSVTGLYPGQILSKETVCEEVDSECLE